MLVYQRGLGQNSSRYWIFAVAILAANLAISFYKQFRLKYGYVKAEFDDFNQCHQKKLTY